MFPLGYLFNRSFCGECMCADVCVLVGGDSVLCVVSTCNASRIVVQLPTRCSISESSVEGAREGAREVATQQVVGRRNWRQCVWQRLFCCVVSCPCFYCGSVCTRDEWKLDPHLCVFSDVCTCTSLCAFVYCCCTMVYSITLPPRRFIVPWQKKEKKNVDSGGAQCYLTCTAVVEENLMYT